MPSATSPERRKRSPRVRVPSNEPVNFVVDGKPVAGQLQKISITGGLAVLAQPVKPGSFADIELQTAVGKVKAAVEFLQRQESAYAFRFVVLDGKDQKRLDTTLSLMRKQGLGM